MASYSGYINVGHNSYSEWESNTLNNSYDVDGSYGYQCWDFISLFYFNVGFPIGYPILTNSNMYTMWNNRLQNISYNGTTYFDLITSVQDIKQGDIVVFNYNSSNPFGHAGFAIQDFSNWQPEPSEPYEFPILSQNNGGAFVNIHGYDIRLFLGAFRYKNWHITPPVPPTPSTLRRGKQFSKFPFVLYARKLRNNR